MTFPPPHPSSQNSIASSTNKAPGARLARPQPSAWGPSAQPSGARRGLTPLSTNVAPPSSLGSPSRRLNTSDNTSATSPFASTFSSVLTSSSRLANSRNNSSSSSSASPFATLQSGSQQLPPSQLLSSPRVRAITPSSNPHLASSAAASTTASQGGGGGGSSGGGGASRNATFSPSLSQTSVNSPTNTTFDRGATTTSVSNTNSNNSASVSKIVIAQIFLLLGSITDKEGKTKWESQADQIQKVCGHEDEPPLSLNFLSLGLCQRHKADLFAQLIDSNGMEVFSKYFRRLLVGNSPSIFPGINRNVENPGNYQLLVQEMQKVSRDPDQAYKIADTIDTSDGDIFRDFDLSTFMDHFKLDPLAKTTLALAFKAVSRSDLKTKGTWSLALSND